MTQAIRVREGDYDRLKAWCKRRGVSMAETFAQLVDKLEVKKLESEKEDMAICDECEEEIPEDASFCPYCGVEFVEEEDVDVDEDEVDEGE